ncbi:hypothetical protein [Curtobacterium sp. Leaf261]|uniref:hypothetical protein n=1 Tax=Curtobacterium sp. Leaf261 TaxID=1736311 RepID=UPI0006FD6FF4|nr:hypothetical protein [Curtobacterium sp. Leaf261]KQO64890.1 hypothetical protein ASF23_01560 [Curtobacterium sp. Leaf261]
MGERLDAWNTDDDVDLYPERPGTADGAAPPESRRALVTGWAVSAVSSLVNVALLGGALLTPVGGQLMVAAFLLVPIAIVTITLCGTFTRRDRRWLVLAGVVLLASPFVGSALAMVRNSIG